MSEGFQLRAPWYVRERRDISLLDPRALRPSIQMYDGTDFVHKLNADPAISMAYGLDDRWSYPVPVVPSITAKGRDRFITSRLVHTKLRKLYQPSHSRFYAVVVEVFCDAPGLPRAGSHTDIDVSFVMRRQHTFMTDERGPIRKLAKKLMAELAADQYPGAVVGSADRDVRDLWWASEADRVRFEQDNAELLTQVDAHTEEQAWIAGPAGGQWRAVDAPPALDRPDDAEEHFPMWRLPPREQDCEAAKTRSLWFGLVPTYSAEHWTDDNARVQQKLDDHGIYQLRCIVTQQPARGHEHCPPKVYIGEPTRPFRLAAAFDPDGTKNHTVSITTPDLRRLAARAGQKQGPGGVRITTPPQSGLSPVDFKSIPGAGIGTLGGGAVCTFAIELFFMVAFFLFLLFLPIVMLAFQLWWMLALRFCIPPSLSFKVLGDFFAGGGVLGNLQLAANADLSLRLDEIIGVHDAATVLLTPPPAPPPTVPPTLPDPESFAAKPDKIVDLLVGIDPKDAQLTPIPPILLESPPDPLCPVD